VDIKLSQLPTAANSTPSDFMMIVQNGVNKQITLSTLLNTLDSNSNIYFNPSQIAINFRVSSSNLTNLLFTSGSSDSIGINTNSPQALLHVNGNVKLGLSGNTPITATGISWGTGGIVTVSVPSTASLVAGQTVLLSGISIVAYNGAYQIISIVNSTSFTYLLSGYTGSSPGTPTLTGGVAGYLTTVSSAGNGITLNSDETVYYPSGTSGYISLNSSRDLSVLVVPTGSTTGTFSLGNGTIGQYKSIVAASITSGGSVVIMTKNFSNSVGWNQITISSSGGGVMLRCISINGQPWWVCVGSYGATLTTTT